MICGWSRSTGNHACEPGSGAHARHDLQLPADAQPDALGLHEHQNQRILRLKDRHYVVAHEAASDAYRIQHPTRPEAYSPATRTQ